jgi:hypothetical protein
MGIQVSAFKCSSFHVKVTHAVYTSIPRYQSKHGIFYVPTPKKVDSCKELDETSSPHKHITSPLLPNSKAFVVANLTIKKEFKLVDQVGEENNGGNSDQDGIGDVAMEHIEDEFEEQEKHDEKHEEFDDELQLTTKKTKASLA